MLRKACLALMMGCGGSEFTTTLELGDAAGGRGGTAGRDAGKGTGQHEADSGGGSAGSGGHASPVDASVPPDDITASPEASQPEASGAPCSNGDPTGCPGPCTTGEVCCQKERCYCWVNPIAGGACVAPGPHACTSLGNGAWDPTPCGPDCYAKPTYGPCCTLDTHVCGCQSSILLGACQ